VERREEVVVADASIIVKWFVKERYSDKALDLRDDYVGRLTDITCPELLPFEVLNALRYNPDFGETDLKDVAVALERYCFWFFPLLGDLAERSIENAFRHGVSVYDASYVSLGEIKGVTFYTADEKLLRKFKDLPLVRHISEYRRKSFKRKVR